MANQAKHYTENFKLQIINLINSGKPRSEIIREYKIPKSTLGGWLKNYNATKSFKAVDNMSEDQKLLLKLEKENKQLKMENDLLKQVALIMGRK